MLFFDPTGEVGLGDLTGGDDPSPRDECDVTLLRLSCRGATRQLFAASPPENPSRRCPVGRPIEFAYRRPMVILLRPSRCPFRHRRTDGELRWKTLLA